MAQLRTGRRVREGNPIMESLCKLRAVAKRNRQKTTPAQPGNIIAGLPVITAELIEAVEQIEDSGCSRIPGLHTQCTLDARDGDHRVQVRQEGTRTTVLMPKIAGSRLSQGDPRSKWSAENSTATA